MDEKEVLGKVADTIVQSALKVDVDIINPGKFEKVLIKFGLKPSKKTFEIPPLVCAKGMRIAKELLSVDIGILKGDNLVANSMKLFAENGDLVARCLAISVGDARKEPNPELIQFFLCNLTPREGALIIQKLLDRVDVTSFMSTIISATGGMSLLNPRETIAPGPSSEGYASTSASPTIT